MRLLGIESSTAAGSVALVQDGNLLGARRWKTEKGHAERLILEVDRLLKQLSLKIEAVDAYAVSIGPGSFTGLRVALATVKGLAMARRRLVVPVSTLEALARNAPDSSSFVCPLLYAGREEVYAALFHRDEKDCWTRVLPDQVVAPADLLKQLRTTTTFLGEGAVRYEASIRQAMGKTAIFGSINKNSPSAAVVARLGFSALLQGKTAQACELVPAYLRRPEAQVKFEKQRRENEKQG